MDVRYAVLSGKCDNCGECSHIKFLIFSRSSQAKVDTLYQEMQDNNTMNKALKTFLSLVPQILFRHKVRGIFDTFSGAFV